MKTKEILFYIKRYFSVEHQVKTVKSLLVIARKIILKQLQLSSFGTPLILSNYLC